MADLTFHTTSGAVTQPTGDSPFVLSTSTKKEQQYNAHIHEFDSAGN